MPKKCGFSISYMNLFKRELERVQHSHTNHFMYLSKKLCMSLLITDYLIGLAFWAFPIGLEWDQKGTNKTLAPMGLELFCQLLTNPKLPLIIFNTTIYNCTLGLINKLYPKTLLYMQFLHKIFVVIQSHEYRLLLCKLLHLSS